MTMDMLNTPVFNLMSRSDPLDIVACRACLKTDIKLFCLHKYGLAQCFGEIAGTTVSQSDGLPQYVCYVCFGLLQKSSAFRRRCREAHIVLQSAYEHQLGITTDYVRTLDKSNFSLPLAASKVVNIAYLPFDEFDSENINKPNFDSDTNFDFQEIKPEVFLHEIEDNYDFPQEDTSHDLHDDLDDDPQDDLPLKPSSGFTSENLDVKSEDKEQSERPVAKKRSLRDRDVKKSKVKSAKSVKASKKVPAKKQAAKKVKKEEIIKPEKEKRIEKEKKIKAKKNRYNQKFEEDFEGFAKTYNCEVVVLTKEQQIQRIQERHKTNGTGRLTCDVCFKKFFTESAYKNHMQLHDPSSGEYICEVCQSRYPTKKALQRHARTHRLEFICKICNLVNKCTERAKLHYQWHQGMKHECEHCKKKFNAHSSKLNHVREHHTPAGCKDCDKICSGTIELAKHRAKVHAEIRQPRHWYGKKKKQNNCETCGVEFLDAQALQRHRNLDNPCDERKKPCVICGFSFHSEQELTRHNTEKHYNSVFKCTACPATFTTDRKLGIHWKRFHIYQDPAADKPDGAPPARPAVTFMCEVCAKSYHTAGQLRIHQRIHTGEKPFKCPLCPKSFRDKTNVQVHINIHTGERPFKCRFCPETFKSYAQRYKHKLLVHTKERNYKCHMCEKTYIVSCDLKMHIRTAHMHIPRPPRNRNRNKINNLIPKQQIENLTYNNPLNQPK